MPTAEIMQMDADLLERLRATVSVSDRERLVIENLRRKESSEMRGLEPGWKNHSTERVCPKVENAQGVPSGATESANGDGCIGAVKDRPAEFVAAELFRFAVKQLDE